MASEYMILRTEDESERLVKQHDMWIQNLGYRIHPRIAKALPSSDVRIADVGCGTGIWIIDLALHTHNPSWRFDGSDISDDHFPQNSSASASATAKHIKGVAGISTEGDDISVLPNNVNLHVQDIKTGFPAEYHGQYDVVHVRLMMSCLDPHEWAIAVANLSKILKPGGWIQWEELDINPHSTMLRSGPEPPNSEFSFLQKGFNYLLDFTRYRIENAPRRVVDAFRQCSLKEVQTDVVCSDRIPGMRKRATTLQMHVMRNIGKKRIESGDKDAWTLDELERVGKGIDEEVERGLYSNYYIQCAIGRI